MLLSFAACAPDGAEIAPPPTAMPPATPERRCGDSVCDGPETAALCPEDCAAATLPSAHPTQSETLPLYVTVYYHVVPNPQLFEAVEPGYFEAVSLTLRQLSAALAELDVHATFCFAWLYNDLVYCRNHDPPTGRVVNRPEDTGIETYRQIVADGHELAYHTHPPYAVREGSTAYYARPDDTCQDYDHENLHRYSGLSADYFVAFRSGVYQFDDPGDPWYGQFTWERTSETLFLIADHLGANVRHANGGQRPLLDVMDVYGSGINHEHALRQLRSLMATGFDLVARRRVDRLRVLGRRVRPRARRGGVKWWAGSVSSTRSFPRAHAAVRKGL